MTYAGVFLLCCMIEVLYARWAIAVQNRNPLLAGLAAGALQIPVVVGLLTVVVSGWYIIPNVLGHGIGSYVIVRLARGSKDNDNEEDGGAITTPGGR